MLSAFDQISREMKSHPFTLVLILITLGGLWYLEKTHADTGEVERLYAAHEATIQKVNLLVEINVAFSLRQARGAWCVERNMQARQVLERSIDRYLIEYREVTGQGYRLAACAQNEPRSTD